MATYPDDATAPITSFGVVSDVTFTNTGASRTDFNLAAAADHRGEVVAFIDGVTQRTSSYDVSNAGQTVSFLTAPNASNLTLKTISLIRTRKEALPSPSHGNFQHFYQVEQCTEFALTRILATQITTILQDEHFLCLHNMVTPTPRKKWTKIQKRQKLGWFILPDQELASKFWKQSK